MAHSPKKDQLLGESTPWFVLGFLPDSRVNAMLHQRDRVIDNHQGEDLSFWQSKEIDQCLGDFIPDLDQQRTGFPHPRSQGIQHLFNFHPSLKDLLTPPVFSLKAIRLQDACLLGFLVQHTLCDAYGRFILPGQREICKDETYAPARLAKLQLNVTQVGWRSFLSAGIRQFWGPSRSVERTLLIPNEKLNILQEECIKAGVKVTTQDLMMACIYQASTAGPSCKQLGKESHGFPPFSFVMTIRRQIAGDSELHNPFVVVAVPAPKITPSSEISTIISLATHIRSTVVNARSLECLNPLVNQYRDARGKPLILSSPVPVTWVSSWTHLPWYDLELQTGKQATARPEYMQGFLRSSGVLNNLGQRVENLLFTWKDPRKGIWIYGNVEEELGRLQRRRAGHDMQVVFLSFVFCFIVSGMLPE
ncbi:hypothetical protein P175DRAFT_0531957 [Aspergillus ochraceoroseus IBT 24754]|uniref:Condensation domain-containing protein n=1 Tax=Aspergillus ochraceoroseus IBT 24754 TaxID=1392256 RepID=A0A2T5LWG7_9EURO|nr:uncharacterized protein P175DRAFT_0531957 [Aspergillus ochraceoroseus IBT 24754]PTU20617.1 hypothetical protein P175DRAFT_0531957 [Aspergillus ochraceoroseus IBT 24754]